MCCDPKKTAARVLGCSVLFRERWTSDEASFDWPREGQPKTKIRPLLAGGCPPSPSCTRYRRLPCGTRQACCLGGSAARRLMYRQLGPPRLTNSSPWGAQPGHGPCSCRASTHLPKSFHTEAQST